MQTVNKILDSIHSYYTEYFWLACDRYDDLPEKQHGAGKGTKTPIPKDFKSPWVGRGLDELVKWLQTKPESADINERFFAVLDKGARDDPPTIVICRIGDLDRKGDKVFKFRYEPLEGAEYMVGAPPDFWDENERNGVHIAEIEYDEDEA